MNVCSRLAIVLGSVTTWGAVAWWFYAGGLLAGATGWLAYANLLTSMGFAAWGLYLLVAVVIPALLGAAMWMACAAVWLATWVASGDDAA